MLLGLIAGTLSILGTWMVLVAGAGGEFLLDSRVNLYDKSACDPWFSRVRWGTPSRHK
jgi:hypothetical protein